MHLGIDITSIIYQRGVSRYTHNLVRALAEQPGLHLNLFGSSLRQFKELNQIADELLKNKSRGHKQIFRLPPSMLSELWRFYGASAPNLRMVVRSHRHRYIHVDAPPDLQVVVTPAWQLKTAFAYKRATSMLPQVGYVTIEANADGLAVRRRIYPLPALHIEGQP